MQSMALHCSVHAQFAFRLENCPRLVFSPKTAILLGLGVLVACLGRSNATGVWQDLLVAVCTSLKFKMPIAAKTGLQGQLLRCAFARNLRNGLALAAAFHVSRTA